MGRNRMASPSKNQNYAYLSRLSTQKLLELLAEFQISVPELGTFRAVHQPYVILTSYLALQAIDDLLHVLRGVAVRDQGGVGRGDHDQILYAHGGDEMTAVRA